MAPFPQRPRLSKEQREARDAERREAATQAMADHDAGEQRKRKTFERLRAERLARERSS